MHWAENAGGRGGVLGLLGSLASDDVLSNRQHGSLRVVELIEGGLGGGSNGSVISTLSFTDDRLKCALRE
jgi:hypothetical protein